MSNPSKPKSIVVDKVIGIKPETSKTSITEKDAILYAIGIGFNQDPLRQQDFKYTNEFHSDFTTFPTVGVVVPRANLIAPLLESEHMPAFSPFQILHAEHKLTLVKQQIQIGAEYAHERELIDCLDKGKNAFILFQGNSYLINEKGEKQLAFQVETLIFIKGLGGFNFEGKGFIKPALQLPKRSADWKLSVSTYANQAFIYRLCFDFNPLHIDPNISKAQNFQRPILHGLASYGTVAKVIVQQLLDNDPKRFQTMQARFVGHVYPGETLDIQVWKEGERYIYEAEVRERKTKALIGYIEARPKPKL